MRWLLTGALWRLESAISGRTAGWGCDPLPGRNLSFFAVDLADAVETRREMVGGLLGEVMESFRRGDLSPEPTSIFPVSAAGDAFQHIAQAAHIGKVVLGMDDPKIEIRPKADRLHADASYLITGGLGGVGLQIATALVGHGARHLVLTSRRAPSATALEAISRLQQDGAEIEIRQADISDPGAVTALLAGIGRPTASSWDCACSRDPGPCSSSKSFPGEVSTGNGG